MVAALAVPDSGAIRRLYRWNQNARCIIVILLISVGGLDMQHENAVSGPDAVFRL